MNLLQFYVPPSENNNERKEVIGEKKEKSSALQREVSQRYGLGGDFKVSQCGYTDFSSKCIIIWFDFFIKRGGEGLPYSFQKNKFSKC